MNIADFASVLSVEPWVWQAFVVVFLTLVASYTARRLLLAWGRRLERTPTPWDDALVDSIRRPLRVFVWVVGIAFAASLVPVAGEGTIFEAVDAARDVGVVACIAWFLVRFVSEAEKNLVARGSDADAGTGPDRATLDAIAKLLRVSIIITAGLVVMQTLGFSISGVLAFGGIGGIAIGFAARDMLANFFGALMIYLDRPFSVGETIRSPDREIMGTVEQIGWRLTRIRTFDNRPLFVPNSVFATIAIENFTRMLNRRIYETIGVRYDDSSRVQPIVDEVRAMLESHPGIDPDEFLMVNFNAFAPSSLDFFIYAFTRTKAWDEYHEVKQDVLLEVNAIIERHGAEIAFPTTTVHVAGSGVPFPAAGPAPVPAGRPGVAGAKGASNTDERGS